MTLLILHLSDIHLQEASDPILKRPGAIAATLNPHLPDASHIVILLSGDIAQSGLSEQYGLASSLLEDLERSIRAEKPNIQLSIVAAPGNHDCDFTGDQEARLAIVAAAAARKSGNMPESFIATATAVQQAYFSFRAKHAPKEVAFDDPLWTTYEISVGHKKIHIHSLNASWMSTIQERQGGLLFPFERYDPHSAEHVDANFSILHHPFNWYSQSNYLSFRDFLQRRSDIIFSGHEHQTDARASDDARSGESVHIEGGALQTRTSLSSAFNIVCIDLEGERFCYQALELSGDSYQVREAVSWSAYRAMPKRGPADMAITEDFRRRLTSPGATLRHPSGRELTLGDIYVYPDLDARQQRDKEGGSSAKKLSSKILTNPLELAEHVLVGGEESSGKTKLLHRLCLDYHSLGYLPLLVDGKRLKSATGLEIDTYVGSAVAAQYGADAKARFSQAAASKKVLLLDDLDLSQLNAAGKAKALDRLAERFGRLIVTVSEDYKLTNIFDPDDLEHLTMFKHYRISPLGHERRAELVRKWNSIGTDETTTTNQLLQACDDAERLIESAQLQHVASTGPIFILSLLQATASGLTKELHNSSFANYYSFLIVGGLEKGGVRPNQIAPYIAACTHLSWYIKSNGEDQQISLGQYREFVTNYSRTWTETDATHLLNVLTASGLIEQDGETIFFAYPYVYYFFLGRYASVSLHEPEVLEYLQFCIKHLYVRECANALLFLAHHTGTSDVLDHVVAALTEQFSTRTPVTLERADVATIAKLVAQAPAIQFSAKKPEDYRRERAIARDESDNGHDGLKPKARPESSQRDLWEQVVSLTKSLEIAGALLTHQFANYTRAKKDAAIAQIFNAALRGTRELFSYFDSDPEELVRAVTARVRKRKNIDPSQAEQETRHSIGLLLRAISTSFIVRAGAHVSSPDLLSNVEGVVAQSPSCAFRLIRLSQQLSRPNRLPRMEIGKLAKDNADNACVMSVLQLLVLNRMYMYETDFDDRDWAIEIFGLGASSNSIELRQRAIGDGRRS